MVQIWIIHSATIITICLLFYTAFNELVSNDVQYFPIRRYLKESKDREIREGKFLDHAIDPHFLDGSSDYRSNGFYQRIMRNINQMPMVVFDDVVKFHEIDLSILGFNLTFKEGIHSDTGPYVAQELNKGEYSLQDLKDGNYIPENSTILDLGTNTGITAVVMAKLFPTVQIIGVEPVPHNYATALANIALNKVSDRVHILNAGLSSDVIKPLLMRYSIQNPGCSTSHYQNFLRGKCGRKGLRNFWIHTITVEEIFKHFNLTTVPFIKLDCEGCEYDIIPTLPEYLQKIFREAILLGEVHASVMKLPKHAKEFTHAMYNGYTQEMCTECTKEWIPPHRMNNTVNRQ